jgi:hypothetical protein
MQFGEKDLEAVKQIQELAGISEENAKAKFRQAANKLANPEVEGRHELVLENIKAELAKQGENGVKNGEKKPKLTRNEKRLAKKEKQATAKKAKAAKPKTPKTPRVSKPREEPFPLTELSREVELKPLDDSPFYQVKFGSANATALFLERDRAAGSRFAPIHLADTKVTELKKAAKKNEQDAVVCVALRTNGKVEQGYIVPISSFKYLSDENPYHQLRFSNSDRKAHAEVGYDDAKFVILKAETKAAA